MKKDKKAFGDAISTLIMFIAVISVTIGVAIAFKNYAVDTQDSISAQNSIVSNQLRTAISITNVVYNSTTNITYVYMKNIGETKLPTEDFDFFLDEAYISPYNVTYADNLSNNATLAIPGESIVFFVKRYLAPGTHEAKLVSGYGSPGDSDYFNN